MQQILLYDRSKTAGTAGNSRIPHSRHAEITNNLLSLAHFSKANVRFSFILPCEDFKSGRASVSRHCREALAFR